MVAKRDDNMQHKQFLPSEALALAAALEEREKNLAKKRMVADPT